MRLFLSSYHIGSSPEFLRNFVGSRRKTAIITNAGDVWDGYSARNLPKFMSDLASAGLKGEEVNLKNYFGQTEKLGKDLSEVGLIWVTGGNTFVLRRAMRESGFDLLLPELLRSEDIVYGGFSAGVCVLSPSLKGIHLADEPDKVSEVYGKEIL